MEVAEGNGLWLPRASLPWDFLLCARFFALKTVIDWKRVFREAGGLAIKVDVLFRCFLSLCGGSVITAGLLLGNLIQHQVSNVFSFWGKMFSIV